MAEDPELLYACYLSGQISERQWQEHLVADGALRAWVEKRAERPRSAGSDRSLPHRPRRALEPLRD